MTQYKILTNFTFIIDYWDLNIKSDFIALASICYMSDLLVGRTAGLFGVILEAPLSGHASHWSAHEQMGPCLMTQSQLVSHPQPYPTLWNAREAHTTDSYCKNWKKTQHLQVNKPEGGTWGSHTSAFLKTRGNNVFHPIVTSSAHAQTTFQRSFFWSVQSLVLFCS